MSFPYGTWVNQTSKPSLNKQTYITQLLNSWPKHLTLGCSVFRHGCIQRHKIQEKSILDAKTHFKWTETFLHTHFTSCHPPSVKKDLSKEKPWESYEKTPQKQPLRKIIQKTLDGRRLPTNFDRRPTIRNKIHKNESKLLKQNLQGGKRFIAICDTIPTLSVY